MGTLVAAASPWPAGFVRVPDEPWAHATPDPFGAGYDAVQHHGWYANLDPTVAEVAGWLADGALVADYSGGTGILQERLLAARPGSRAGLLNADASAKFLGVAAAKLGGDPRCAFRLLRALPDAGRLQRLEEAALELAGRLDGIACANAAHLYPELDSVAASWAACLRPGGRLHVQSGNVAQAAGPSAGPGEDGWIIDATVEAIGRAARRRVLAGPRFAAHQAVLADETRMAAYAAVRDRYFPPPRPLGAYLDALRGAGFVDVRVRRRPVEVRRDEWLRFLAVYHEGILPWVGGCARVDGKPPSDEAVRDRLELLEAGLADAVGPTFTATWTYIDARKSDA